MLVAEERLLGRLSLANYLGGALVGLGLVGTFVGLLEALADLGAMFTSLMADGKSAAGADPVAMFKQMLGQLREPMKGMGTAFVASLYGLLGSLIIGLVANSVKQSGKSATEEVRRFLRRVPMRQNGETEGEMLSRQVESLAFILASDRLEIRNALSGIASAGREQAQASERLTEAGYEHVRKLETLGKSIEDLAEINSEIAGQASGQLDRLKALGDTMDASASRLARRLGAVLRASRSPTYAIAAMAAVVAIFSVLVVREFMSISRHMEAMEQSIAMLPMKTRQASPEELALLSEISNGIKQSVTEQKAAQLAIERARREPARKHVSNRP